MQIFEVLLDESEITKMQDSIDSKLLKITENRTQK
jgi:hypothetical protein